MLDTSILIYYLEANEAYAELPGEIFAWVEKTRDSAMTSTMTMAELLVRPYRGMWGWTLH